MECVRSRSVPLFESALVMVGNSALPTLVPFSASFLLPL